MDKLPPILYTLILLAIYAILSLSFPEFASRALLSMPILITIIMGYVGGLKHSVIASVLGPIVAFILLSYGAVRYDEDFPIRVLAYVIIVSVVNYTQWLRDRVEKTSLELDSRDVRISEMAAIVESSDDAIISKTLDGIVKTWNKGAEQLYGFRAEEIVGKSILLIFPEGYEDEEAKILGMMRRGERLDHYETIRKHKDGHLIEVSLTVSPVFDEKGRVIAVSKIARDITQQKEYQREIQRAAERYKTFIERSESAIWLIEYKTPIDINLAVEKQVEKMYSEGFTSEANQKTAELFGKEDINDFIGKSILLISPRTDIGDEFLKNFISQNYRLIDTEVHIGDRYGSISFTGVIEDGKLVRAWTVLRDITERKLQAQEVERGQQRYQTFIENSEEGIARIEFKSPIDTSWRRENQVKAFFAEGYIAEANKATATIMGMPSLESITNKPLDNIEVKSDGDVQFIREFINNGYSLQDFESVEQRGDKLTYHSSSMKGIIENGQWVRAWMVRRDITPQKEHLIERERLLKEAEDAKRGLEVASVEKDRFLANLSHELRTPLVSILGYSSMLMETEPDPEAAKKMITTINKNAKLQVQLIEDLLDLSRIISGKIELKKEFFKLSDFAKDAVDTLRKEAADKNLIVHEMYDECQFYGDRKRLSQVLLNLLSNAIKFTEKGEIWVSARCNEEFVTLKVVDTGIGIDPKNFDQLFKPFKQLDSSSTRGKQGLGLGLSIVKNITELHGGNVQVESKLGEGSQFCVHLPVIQASLIADAQDIHVTPSVSFEGINILLVEDDADSAGFVQYLYEKKGAKVSWAASAKKAREFIAQNKYDIYIFDLSMPEEDGISLIKSVRAAKDTTKAVALTAFADTYYEQKAIEAGFDMFLKKPTPLPDLLSVIKLIR